MRFIFPTVFISFVINQKKWYNNIENGVKQWRVVQ